MRWWTKAVVAGLALLVACSSGADDTARGPGDAAERPGEAQAAIAEAGNAFAARLYRQLVEEDAEAGNVFISPFSVSSALAMTWAGARGETAEQMADVLAVPVADGRRWPNERYHAAMGALTAWLNREDAPFELTVANALWGERTMPFREAYLDTVQPVYDAGFEMLDFRERPEAARQRINEWVEQQTRQRIRDLLPEGSVTVDSRLVLTNAIYFKAAWDMPFDERRTRPRDFHLDAERSVQVPTMHHARLDAGHLRGDGYQVIDLDYEDGDVGMMIVLPDAVDGLPAIEKQLDAQRIARWREAREARQLDIYLPRFRTETQYTLNDTLTALGMGIAFTRDADFTGLTESIEGEALAITHVEHKAFIEVDEAGTEAAAATGVVVDRLAAPVDPPIEVRVDRPFLYLIYDRPSGAVLFLGRTLDPR